jgi:hypothetical protein
MQRAHKIRLNPTPEQEIYVDGHFLKVPKLGRVNLTESLRLAGKIMGATISYRAGWWWVSIQVDVPLDTRKVAGRHV